MAAVAAAVRPKTPAVLAVTAAQAAAGRHRLTDQTTRALQTLAALALALHTPRRLAALAALASLSFDTGLHDGSFCTN
jgi:hypothetical protein